jgi:uncharacterized damage-inducible protein DinB
MLKMLTLYAVYNRDMDNVIIDLLSGFPPAELDQERRIFCRSISHLFAHLVRAGWYYQAAIKRISYGTYLNDIGKHEEIIQRIESSFEDAAGILKEADGRLIRMLDVMPVQDLDLAMENFQMYDGRVGVVSIGEVLLQHMTHQTHHRGQLSQVLDELGIVHDIGNIWPYVKVAPAGGTRLV